MNLRQKLLENKNLYLKNKKDVRFLKDAIWSLVYEYYQTEKDKSDVEWIIDGL